LREAQGKSATEDDEWAREWGQVYIEGKKTKGQEGESARVRGQEGNIAQGQGAKKARGQEGARRAKRGHERGKRGHERGKRGAREGETGQSKELKQSMCMYPQNIFCPEHNQVL
jgi:hypothetical protein